MLYSYDTRLDGGHSFQEVEAILASAFRLGIQAVAMQDSNSTEPKTIPSIFIVHYLSGLTVKDSILQMKHDENHQAMLESIRGALLFGVLSKGVDIAPLISMVKDHSNQALLHSFGKGSQMFRNQSRVFLKAFDS